VTANNVGHQEGFPQSPNKKSSILVSVVTIAIFTLLEGIYKGMGSAIENKLKLKFYSF